MIPYSEECRKLKHKCWYRRMSENPKYVDILIDIYLVWRGINVYKQICIANIMQCYIMEVGTIFT